MNLRLRKAVLALLATAVLASALWAAAPAPAPFQVRTGDSSVSFSIMKWGVFKEEGRFRDFRGSIHYDPASPAAARVEFTVHAASIDTGIAGRDRTLRGDDFFHVERYPTLSFRSTAVEPTAEKDLLHVTGDLTIRGVPKRVTVPVRVLGTNRVGGEGELAGFEIGFTLDRTDFGVNGSRWSGGRAFLSHEVDVRLRIAASRP